MPGSFPIRSESALLERSTEKTTPGCKLLRSMFALKIDRLTDISIRALVFQSKSRSLSPSVHKIERLG